METVHPLGVTQVLTPGEDRGIGPGRAYRRVLARVVLRRVVLADVVLGDMVLADVVFGGMFAAVVRPCCTRERQRKCSDDACLSDHREPPFSNDIAAPANTVPKR
jgi:hypothetical protein